MAAPNSNSPAILPISNPQSTTADNPNPSAARAFLSTISSTVRSSLATRRPWPELLDRSAFSKPESLSDAAARLRKNYAYFRTNYAVALAAVVAVSLLTNPLSLLLLSALLAAWLLLYLLHPSDSPPLVLLGRQFSDRETLLFLIVSTIVVVFLTSVGSVLVSALLVGVAVVCVHGAFRVPEDLFLDEQEPQTGVSGFLSLLSGGAVVAAQPPVAARA